MSQFRSSKVTKFFAKQRHLKIMEYEHGMTVETKGTEQICMGDQQEDRAGSGRCHSWVRMWATLQGRQLRTGFETMVILCTHTKKTQETTAKAHEDGAISPHSHSVLPATLCLFFGSTMGREFCGIICRNIGEMTKRNFGQQ